MLTPGDPAPWFDARSSVNPSFAFDTAGGRYIVLSFFGSASHAPSRRVLDDIEKNHEKFDVLNAAFFGVSADPDDERLARVKQQWPGIVYIWDADLSVAKLYDIVSPDGAYKTCTIILNPAMQVIAILGFEEPIETHVPRIFQVLAQWPHVTKIDAPAPILEIPFVFEPQLCRALIQMHTQQGGQEIGMLRDVNGQTVRVHDHTQKRRTDATVSDPTMLATLQSRLERRVFPEIKKAYQYRATQIERFIVSCYDADVGGYFRSHRDDTTKASAHRRFAVSINLNVEEYEGGALRFPEYGFRTYRAASGTAIVFSCSLLHEVRPVTKGRRYAFLPFIFDDAAAQLRQQNMQYVSPDLRQV